VEGHSCFPKTKYYHLLKEQSINFTIYICLENVGRGAKRVHLHWHVPFGRRVQGKTQLPRFQRRWYVFFYRIYTLSYEHLWLSAYGHLVEKDFWTSGTDQDCDGAYRWCSLNRDFTNPEINWGAAEPKSANGDCVSVRFVNGTTEETVYSTGNCAEEKNFICEVRFAIKEANSVKSESSFSFEKQQRFKIKYVPVSFKELLALSGTMNAKQHCGLQID